VEQRRLRLNEFKALYEALETGTVWIDHLLLGLLYWLESKLIDVRVKNEVDKAIEEVVLPPLPDMVTPLYTETPSKTSTSLPEMRLTAPWYVSPDDTVEGR
jgi:hypothetical protein